MDLVLRLRELRTNSGLSQRQLARASGVGEKTISAAETGARTDSLKMRQLLAILDALGVMPAEFFSDDLEERLLETIAPQANDALERAAAQFEAAGRDLLARADRIRRLKASNGNVR